MTGSSNQETDSTDLLGSDLSNTAIIHETGQLTLEGFPLSVPADQMRQIENINTLIAEVVVMYYLCEFIFFFFCLVICSCENQYLSILKVLSFLNLGDIFGCSWQLKKRNWCKHCQLNYLKLHG